MDTSADSAFDLEVEHTYRQRQQAWREKVERLDSQERWTSWSRLAAMAASLVALWMAVQSGVVPLWVPAFGGAAFLGLVSLHDRLLRRQETARRAVAFYDAGLRRLGDRWHEDGATGDELPIDVQPTPDHPYAADLDLFGRGSLFQLLCRARTVAGQATLARWLQRAADPAEINARQKAVEELRANLDLRERLATLGDEVVDAARLAALERWARKPSTWPATGWPTSLLRATLAVLAAANLAAAAAWWPGDFGPTALLALLVVETLGFVALRGRLGSLTGGVEQTSRSLEMVRALIQELEDHVFESPWLEQRRGRIAESGFTDGPEEHGPEEHGPEEQGPASASAEIDRLRRLVDLLDAQRNPMFAPFALLLLWGPQIALALDAWRRRNGSRVAHWLESIGEIEAAASLACFAYETPGAVFPTLLPAAEGPRFAGRELAHPLLPRSTCVTNSLALGGAPSASPGAPQGFVISGSNMSGKSTFLRACGLNAVLAQAGSVVRAYELELTPLQLATSIRIQDSLQQGHSKFYAEIRRLRLVLDLATLEPAEPQPEPESSSPTPGEPLPVFFLLDEILHGTNSHDRRIGAQAVIEALLDRGAIGLVTTHDLALAKMATAGDAGSPSGTWQRLVNKHFVDSIEEGRIVFDYRLRDGVVTRSNALALMREVGLDV